MKTVRFHSYSAEAYCDDCKWTAHSKNAHGIAAQHHYKTGHTVHIEAIHGHTMSVTDSDWHQSWKETKAEMKA